MQPSYVGDGAVLDRYRAAMQGRRSTEAGPRETGAAVAPTLSLPLPPGNLEQ